MFGRGSIFSRDYVSRIREVGEVGSNERMERMMGMGRMELE